MVLLGILDGLTGMQTYTRVRPTVVSMERGNDVAGPHGFLSRIVICADRGTLHMRM